MDRGKIIWDGPTDQYLDILKSKRHEKSLTFKGIIRLFHGHGDIHFLVWANNTELDLITKGNGRIITAGQNQIVQSPFKGILNSIEVELALE